ncbi:response regulator transcription factor [bacterium]|nr:response regulator transcription factor [bacterium]
MNILIIEDSPNVAHLVGSIIRSKGHIEKHLKSPEISLQYFKDNLFEVVIINTNLQYGTHKLIREIRRYAENTFIIGVSTKSTWKEKVEFLNAGGDDVLDYPFPMQELEARINSLLRRPKKNNQGILKVKNVSINTDLKQVNVGAKPVPLRRREFALLEYMVKNKERTITRAELLDHVWDYRRSTGSNTVDVHVKRLRDKLMDKDLIETVHGFGYAMRDKKIPKAS